ncbi:hypothetical protein ACOME3_006060 [Neoechinorhynchus agilis]
MRFFCFNVLILFVLVDQSQLGDVEDCLELFSDNQSIVIQCGLKRQYYQSALGLNEILNNFDRSNIQILHLIGVPIDQMSANLTNIFPQLTLLSVHNYNGSCQNKALDFIQNVKSVHLTRVRIENLSVSWKLRIKDLCIQGCNLSILEPGFGKKLPFLETLNLKENLISNIDPIGDLCELRVLKIDINQIKVLNLNGTKCLGRLSELSSFFNPIESVQVEGARNLKNLKKIGVEFRNYLENVMISFENIPRLESVIISHSNNSNYDASKLKNLPKLTTLGFINGSLLTIPRGGLLTSENIVDLKLSNNLIAKITKSDFTYWKKLKSLDLSNNLIESIPAGVFNSLVDLANLQLSGNNLHNPNLIAAIIHHKKLLKRRLKLAAVEKREVVKPRFKFGIGR